MTHHHTTLGFEIEFTRRADLDTALAHIRQTGIDSNKPALANIVDERTRYTTTFYSDRWVQGYDMSCGYELKSHPLTDTSEVCDVMRGLRLAGATVNNSCGLHIHVGIGTFTTAQMRRLAKIYARYEPALERLLPRSRRGRSSEGYAKSNFLGIRDLTGTVGDDLGAHFARLDGVMTKEGVREIANPNGKYSKMNLGPYFDPRKGDTVEFRAHSGTLNFAKIDGWASVLVAMVKMAQERTTIEPKVASFSEMLDDLVGVEQATDSEAPSPGAGTKSRAIWDACSDLLEADPARFFSSSDFTPSGHRVQNHGDLRAFLMATLGTAQGTTHVAITRWAQARGLTSRPSDSRSGLRSFLQNRAADLDSRSNR